MWILDWRLEAKRELSVVRYALTGLGTVIVLPFWKEVVPSSP
jgi:hypothetical protein